MSILSYLGSEIFEPTCDLPDVDSYNADKVCEEIACAIKAGKGIFIYGDYDMDGLCCSLIWRDALKDLGVEHPTLFRYGNRTHSIDTSIVRQLESLYQPLVIICDTGSSAGDRDVIGILESYGASVVVIDHHRYTGDDYRCRLIFNPTAEPEVLGGDPISGAYATLLIVKRLYERHFGRLLPYHLKVYALASMYSDVVDLSTKTGRTLYNSVALSIGQNPPIFSEFNKWGYVNGRRFFSYTLAPKVNACFRSERFDLLNSLLTCTDRYAIRDIVDGILDVHSNSIADVKLMVKKFSRERFGDVVLCVAQESSYPRIENYTGLIAVKIAEEEHSAVVVVVRKDNLYRGSYRDYFNRPMLDVFKLFCEADGHGQAFGLRFHDYIDFRKNLSLLGERMNVAPNVSNLTLASNLLESGDDLDAIALYNEYMTTSPRLLLSHVATNTSIRRSTRWNKFYDVGLPDGFIVKTRRPILDGTPMLIEPCLTRGVECMEVDK